MIARLVAFSLEKSGLIAAASLALLVGGVVAFLALDIEAYPNPIPPMIEVITQADGWSAEEMERYVTVPIEVALAGMPRLEHRRSQSLFGLSDVKNYFAFGTDYHVARQEVINRLQFVDLPPGVSATLSPTNATGEVFRYTLEGEGYAPSALKATQDWLLERMFREVPGVIDVTSFGGETKQYHVEVDPVRLRSHNASLNDLKIALANANLNVGGQRLTIGEQSFDVRGLGMLRGVADVAEVVVKQAGGVAVRVRDVADVRLGAAPRLGMVGQDDRPDLVQGVVLMRYGEETPKTLVGIHERIRTMERDHLLPPGMRVVPYYDRGALVNLTTHTVMENAGTGIALVLLVLYLFLGSFRAAAITALNVPMALLVAFIGLVLTGTSANLISLGAVDFGIVADSTVIMMENIFHHLGRNKPGTISERVLAAAREVGRPMIFSTGIIAVSFLPLFSMTGVSGIIFEPMARTYAFAIFGALVLALTLTPVLTSRFLDPALEEKPSILLNFLHRAYDPLFSWALAHPKGAALIRFVPLCASAVLFPLLGSEFMPKLEEGNIWLRATLPTSISFEQSAEFVSRLRGAVLGCDAAEGQPCDEAHRRYPEVVLAQSQMGRPDDGTDVTGFNNIEIFAPLKPFDEFRPGLTKEKLVGDMEADLIARFPGVAFNFSQMISDNVEEATAGVKGENSIKVFGSDLAQNENLADAIAAALRHVPGVADLGVLRSLGQPSVQITPDRQACARYGLNTGDVDAVVQGAVGGTAVTQVYEGERRFDLVVRWLPEYRSSVPAIRRITVQTPDGTEVPLANVARIDVRDGPVTVYREDGGRYAPVKFSVRGRDLASTIAEAKAAIEREVTLPLSTRLEWAGEINEMQAAQRRLMMVVPISFVLIALLVYFAVHSWLDALVVMIDIPVACTGGLLALLVTGQHFSVSAAMGFVSIFGIAIQDAILVVSYFQQAHLVDGKTPVEAARAAAEKRFRPVLMTTLVACLGLLPAAVSHGIGSQTQKPLAIVVIGGSLMVALLTRILQPTILVLLYDRRAAARATPAAAGGAT